MDINARIAARVSFLRQERGLSLDALATKCSVSRSMISLIERGQSNATAVVLEKLATGLGVLLQALFEDPQPLPSPLIRHADQPEWRDPQSGYLRRNISPPDPLSPLRIVEVLFPAGAIVNYETAARDALVHQQIWVLEGRMDVTVGATHYSIEAGDCLAFQLNSPTAFHNPHRKPARYAVITSTDIARP
ncbi:transcriptional regulator, XRE family with cupin sensor [Collimonas sp. OK242]|jgi:transcriptional regulator with XRE-family HTH domain|uniref:helix-turn-helix domain-containing protein n=1 Tax=Collimonas sp. OK242 TaxID=1798195 RepID=UPI0008960CC0|nr:XRE family transcriptional regulator [Collimonas sp. OK242]SDX09678.1 transcriptional regulator, XRE family with cupin sensor [Collimonas sp. OK242]